MSDRAARAGAVRIGCPARARREEFLRQYAGVFGMTEGSATFHGVTVPERVARWAAEAPAEFRFCYEFPRAVTHDRLLAGAEAETREFQAQLAPLSELLGGYLIKMHERFDARRLGVLEAFLRGLPREFASAVEVRPPESPGGDAGRGRNPRRRGSLPRRERAPQAGGVRGGRLAPSTQRLSMRMRRQTAGMPRSF